MASLYQAIWLIARPDPKFPPKFPKFFSQAAKAYDSVRDTFSKIDVPTEEQAKAYIAMLSSTASLKGDVAAGSIFDFSLAAEAARELAQKK